MKRVYFLAPLLVFVLIASPTFASSKESYQNYLFQSDLYRKAFSEFTVAKNEYQQFKSLASETTALEKTKAMMSSRDLLLRSFLLYLSDKLVENTGLAASQRQLYLSLLSGEISFLEKQEGLIPAIGSLQDADSVSGQLASRYDGMQTTARKAITAHILANLNTLAMAYDQVATSAQNYIKANSNDFSTEKRATLDRWLLQIQSKRSLYQQKVDAIDQKNSKLTSSDTNELERYAAETLAQSLEARQYLREGANFLGELMSAIKYED